MQDEYYSRPEPSNSDLSELNKLLHPNLYDFDFTDSLRFGNLFDCLVTESHKVNVYTRTVEGIDGCYSIADMELAKKMKLAFYRDATCSAFMKIASTQHIAIAKVQFEWNSFKFWLEMRCKFDLMMFPINMGADIKTTTATTDKQFMEACLHFNYIRSRVIYMLIQNTDSDMIIGVSKVNLRIFKIAIKRGDKLWQLGLEQASKLAFEYWLYFDSFTTNQLQIL